MELKILHMSDTHGVHRRLRNLPEADILVHSGDFTMSGSEAETLDYNGPQKLDTELRQIKKLNFIVEYGNDIRPSM